MNFHCPSCLVESKYYQNKSIDYVRQKNNKSVRKHIDDFERKFKALTDSKEVALSEISEMYDLEESIMSYYNLLRPERYIECPICNNKHYFN